MATGNDTTKKSSRTEEDILKQLRKLAEELEATDRRTAVQILCALQDAEDRRNGKDFWTGGHSCSRLGFGPRNSYR